MSRLEERSTAPGVRLVRGNPAVRTDQVRIACRKLEALARSSTAPGVNRSAVVVLSVLLEFLNRSTLDCWPSNETIARRLPRMAARTVRRHLWSLRAAGFISWCPRATKGGRLSNSYRFAFGLVGFPDLYGGIPVPVAKHRRASPARSRGGTFAPSVAPAVEPAKPPVEPAAVVAETAQAGREAAGLCGWRSLLPSRPSGSPAERRRAAGLLQDDLRSCPAVAARWWGAADEAAESLAVDAELAQRGAGLHWVKAWVVTGGVTDSVTLPN